MRSSLWAGAVLALAWVCPVAAQGIGFVVLGPAEPRMPGLDRRVERPLRGTLADVLEQLAAEAGLRLVFAADLPGLDGRVDRAADGAPIRDILRELAGPAGLELRVALDGRAVLTRLVRQPVPDGVGRPIVVRGRVVDSITSAPLHFAAIGAGLALVSTGTTGRFQLRAGSGEPLVVRAIGYQRRRLNGRWVLGDTVDLGEIRLAREPLRLADVVVSPSTFTTGTVAISAQTLNREALERTTQIGEDAYRAINRLPGMQNNDNTSAFRVRGGGHDELYVSLDGQVLLEPFHLKDFDNALSILDPQVVGGVEVITGGFPARFGNRLTGVLTFNSVDRLPGAARYQLGLSIATIRALGSGGFGGDRGSWLATARRGYLDLILAIADPSSKARPRYQDGFAKVSYRLSPALALSLHGLVAHDDLNYQEDPDDPRIDSRYGSAYTWARLQTTGAGPIRADVVASLSHLSWDRLGTRASVFDGAQDLLVEDQRSYLAAGLRADAGIEVAPWLVLGTGVEGRTGRAKYHYLNWRRAFARTAAGWEARYDTTAVDRPASGTEAGGYITARVRPVAALTLELGGRADRWSVIRETATSPRLQAVWSPGQRFSLRGAWGRYVQGQGLHQLQVQDGLDGYQPAERAEQRVLGLDLAMDPRHDVRLEAYDRRYDRVRPRYHNLDGSQELFPELNDDRYRLAPARSEVRGVEVGIRGFDRRLDWSASYQWQRGRDLVQGAWIAREFEQRHSASIDLGWQPTGRWHLSAAYVFHSGWPSTESVYAIEQLPDGATVLGRQTGPLNARRLRDYHRVDLRATRDIAVARGRMRGFVELFNLLDRSNLRGFIREPIIAPDGSLAGTRENDEELYPRLVSFGLYWEF